MQDTYITPITGRRLPVYSEDQISFIDQDKTNFLNKILRGEISAVNAYEQAIPNFEEASDRFRLAEIRNEHDRNIEKLRTLVEHSKFVATDGSGAWGTIVATLVGAANLMGTTVTLKTLQEGEEHGLKLYHTALDFNLTFEERNCIVNEIIPNLRRHVVILETLIMDQNDH